MEQAARTFGGLLRVARGHVVESESPRLPLSTKKSSFMCRVGTISLRLANFKRVSGGFGLKKKG